MNWKGYAKLILDGLQDQTLVAYLVLSPMSCFTGRGDVAVVVDLEKGAGDAKPELVSPTSTVFSSIRKSWSSTSNEYSESVV